MYSYELPNRVHDDVVRAMKYCEMNGIIQNDNPKKRLKNKKVVDKILVGHGSAGEFICLVMV